jgi:hypothetical protein
VVSSVGFSSSVVGSGTGSSVTGSSGCYGSTGFI